MSCLVVAGGWRRPAQAVARTTGSQQSLPHWLAVPGLPHWHPRSARPGLLQNFLYKCVGTTLGAASSKDVVRKLLQELLETARYQEEAEREVPAPPHPPKALGPRLAGSVHCPLLGTSECECIRVCCAQMQPYGVCSVHAYACSCPHPQAPCLSLPGVSAHAPPQGLACCFGICAISHLDDTLAELEDFVRSDVFRKSIGIFNIFKVQLSVRGRGLVRLAWALGS